jgi:hypothetical protein
LVSEPTNPPKKIHKKIPKFFHSLWVSGAMKVSARTMVAELAATTVTLDTIDQTLVRWKRIDELLKSTDESPAQIGRLQNLPQRLSDPRPRRLEAAEQVVKATTPTSSMTTPLVFVPTTCLTSGLQEKYHLSAQNLFDGKSEHQEVTSSHILNVTVTCVLYPIMEKVLHQEFDPYGGEKGVLMMVFERIDHVMALVSFSSPHEATKAREALHSRNIYDGCCRMDIKYLAPLPVCNTAVAASTPNAPHLTPCSASTLKVVDPNEQGDTAMVPMDASSVHHSLALAVAAMSEKCPVMSKEIGVNQMLDKLLSASDGREHVQVQNFPGEHVVEIDTNMSAEVLTHVGGLSLFQELELNSANEAFNDSQYEELVNEAFNDS